MSNRPVIVSMTLYLLCAVQTVPLTANTASPTLLAQEATSGSLTSPQQQPYTLQSGDSGPLRIAGRDAIYPSEAKAQKLNGIIKLQVVTDINGNVTQLTVVSATSSIFVDAAMSAAKTWKFKPYIHNGVLSAASFGVTVVFSTN